MASFGTAWAGFYCVILLLLLRGWRPLARKKLGFLAYAFVVAALSCELGPCQLFAFLARGACLHACLLVTAGNRLVL